MKCNFKNRIGKNALDSVSAEARQQLLDAVAEEIKPQIGAAFDVALKSWELCVALALRDIGFGRKRIEEYFSALRARYGDLDYFACITDTHNSEKMSNLSTTFINGMRELEQSGIDSCELLNINALVINDVDVIKVLNKMNGKEVTT